MKVKEKAFDTKEHLDNVNLWNKLNKEKSLQFNYPHLSSDSVVVDLGAYLGAWSEEILKRYGCTVHAFEPLPEFHSQAIKRLEKYSNSYVHNFAVGDSNRKDKITFFKDGSTFFIAGDKEIEVEVRSFSEVLTELNLEKIDLIKLNVEGSEFEILEQLIKENTLSCSKSYQIQFHRELPNHKERRSEIQKSLKKEGFKCDYNIDWIWESWTKV